MNGAGGERPEAGDRMPARVYWTTAILAIAFMLALYVLTARFHLPPA